MRELDMQPHEAAWWEELAVTNPNPAIGETPPLPGWELCTRETLQASQPDLLVQWEESTERRYHTPDESITEEIAAEKTDPTSNNSFEKTDLCSDEDALAAETVDERGIAAAVQVAARRKGRRKKRYEDMSRGRKAVHIAGLATSVTLMVAPCTADTSTPEQYTPPYLAYTDKNTTQCKPGTALGGLNVNGVGNNKISLYSAQQEEKIMPEQKDVCFAALIYGTDYDVPGNTSVLHEFVEKNKLDKVIIFAFSFGGMATIDMLNEYHRQYPESTTQFAIVYISAPGEFNDLQPDQKTAVRALSLTPLDAASMKWLTYFSIVGQGDKNPLGEDVTNDTEVAASDTPARLLWGQMIRLLFGMAESDMKVTTSMVYDPNDKVVVMQRAINTIVERSGLSFFQVVPMTHTDHRMNNHAAAWWQANNNDYRGPLLFVIEANKREFVRKETAQILAQCVTRGKVILRLAC